MIVFFKVLFEIGVVPTEPNNKTLGEVRLVLVIVKLLSVPPLVLPSTVILLAPANRIKAPLKVPVITRGAPDGLINTEKPLPIVFKATVPSSPERSEIIFKVMLPAVPAELIASKAPPA